MLGIRPHLLMILIVAALPNAARGQNSVAIRQTMKTQSDLPRFTYPITGTATELLNADDATFNAFAARVGADIEKVIASFDITDRDTKRELLNSLQDIAVVRGDDGAVLAIAAQIQNLEDKPEGKLLSSMRLKAMASARRKTGQSTGAMYRKAYADAYAANLKALPWSVIGQTILRTKSSALRQTQQETAKAAVAFIDPVVARTGQLSGELARQLIYQRLVLKAMVPVRSETIAVLQAYIAANRVNKPSIWPARDVTLSNNQKLTLVNVAIWDEGSDLSLFPGQVYTDPNPDPQSGPHGLAFDINSNPTHGELIPLTAEQAASYPSRLKDLQGASDASAGIDSPEADAMIAKMSALSANQIQKTIEEVGFFGGYYAHGTHIAGIAALGNPAIRLAVARKSWDWHLVPAAPTEALIRRRVVAYGTFVKWFRDHNMRVVNMSWGGGPADYERVLEANAVGTDAEERKTLARRLFDIDRTGLLQALQSAPEIVFVSAAGNTNNHTDFNEDVPSTFELPNLITVGAVDQAGDPASFTSFGKTVRVYANGHQVESVVPGGARLRFSGTSVAAPAVVNLAAKLLALSPKLSPRDVIAFIIDGASLSTDGKRRVIDPRRSIQLMSGQTNKNR